MTATLKYKSLSWAFPYLDMWRHIMHCSSLITLFHLLLFFLFICHISSADPLAIETLEDNGGDDDICGKVDCGQGKCVPSNTSFLGVKGFDCFCKPGWQKMQLGPIILPACTIPNCTINYQCGNGAPPPPPPLAADLPPFSLFNPCTFVWCGDGSCVVNGSSYYCKCNEGSFNLFNLTGVACFKQCYLGADCTGVSLGQPVSVPPPPSSSGNTSGLLPVTLPPAVNGTVHVPNCSSFSQWNLLLFSMVMWLVASM